MDLQQSLECILQRDGVVTDLFYEIFLDRYPDVRQYFVGIDLNHQAVVLQMALMTVAVYSQRHYPAAEQYLKYLGHKHDMRSIPQELFPDFRDCLLETLGRFHGGDWSASLQLEWRRALDDAIDVMKQGYGGGESTY